jgi:small subunit ribosomal protein S2
MRSSIHRLKTKMLRNLEGIRKMTRTPDVLVVVDPGREKNAVKEGKKLGIPTIAVIDTDCDPDTVDVPIPANDDAMRSIAVLLEIIGEAVIEGVEKYKAHVGPIPERSGVGRPDVRPVRRRGAPRGGARPGGTRPGGPRPGGPRPGGQSPGRGDTRDAVTGPKPIVQTEKAVPPKPETPESAAPAPEPAAPAPEPPAPASEPAAPATPTTPSEPPKTPEESKPAGEAESERG